MSREDKLNIIYNQFDDSANRFFKDTDGTFLEINSQYKRDEKTENLKNRIARIYYNSFIIEFKYTAHGLMSVINSVLEVVIYLDKSDNVIGIPLPFIVDYCNIDTATPLTIPFITNDKCMIQAFDCLGSIVKSILTDVANISGDNQRKKEVIRRYKDELKAIFDTTILDEEIDPQDKARIIENYYDYLMLRFTSAPFINYLKGDKERAIKQLAKEKNKTGYEKRILTIWKSGEKSPAPQLDLIRENAHEYDMNGVQKANLKEFVAMFLSWIVLSVGISLGYIGLYFLLMYIEGRNSVYLMGPLYNFPFCIVFGFVTSIATSYYTRFAFYKFLFKKDYEKFCEMDYIQNGSGEDRIINIFLHSIVFVSIAGCLLLTKWNINFEQDGFADNTKFFSIVGKYYSYSDIERVYYRADRVNGLGEVLNYPSYVLVLKNGEELDFYEYDDIEQYEEELLDFLHSKGVKIEKVNKINRKYESNNTKI